MPSTPEFALERTEIAGVSVNDLARRFGTPLYVYDAAKIAERIADLHRFDVVRFAQKACSNLAVVDWARRCGALVDCVSAGELHRAMRAGYSTQGDPPPIVYTADIFDQDALDLVARHNVHVNAGSPDMIAQLGQLAPGRNITLRVNPGFGHGHSQKTNTGGAQSKHGIWHDDIESCLRIADQHGLAVTGLHMHIGSGVDMHHLSQVCGAMEQSAEVVGRSLSSISAGGGLPVPYRPEESFVDLDQYFELWDAARLRIAQRVGHRVALEVEPGRYLTAEAGFLIAEIRAVKQMGGNLFYLLDAGFNNLARPVMYGSHHPMSLAANDAERRPVVDVVVGGPLCESGDIFTQDAGGFVRTRSLPQARVGEMLVLENAGAYGFVMSSNYNSKPMTAEVMVRDGQPVVVRERQSYDDLMRGETTLPP